VSRWTLALRSLAYYKWANLAVAAGVAVGVAVIAGSLLVGHSTRASLRDLALKRLGRTTHAVQSPNYFREALADEVRTSAGSSLTVCTPAILAPGAARRRARPDEQQSDSGPRTPQSVQIVAIRDAFWQLAPHASPVTLSGNEAAVNPALAEALDLREGDTLLVTLRGRVAAPVESIFGRRSADKTVASLRLTVHVMLPEGHGLASFSLRGDRPRPRNLFVSLEELQRRLKVPGMANSLLVSTTADTPSVTAAVRMCARLADYGLTLEQPEGTGVLSLQSSRLVLSPTTVTAGTQAAGEAGLTASQVSVYLANTIRRSRAGVEDREIPYSTIAAVDLRARPTGMRLVGGGQPPGLALKDILLNQWAAEQLDAKVADTIEVTYYVRGKGKDIDTRTEAFTLRGIVAMTGLGADQTLVPPYEGITTATSMSAWDPPFDIDRGRIRPADETYWRDYRAAPKAFLALKAVRSMWAAGSDGHPAPTPWITALRITPPEGMSVAEARTSLERELNRRLKPESFGLAVRPVREDALAASKGSTDFAMLFLGLSMFLLASAIGLVALLLRLSAERRASQMGIMLAVGFRPGQAAGTLLREALLVAVAGTLVGIPLGVGYAALVMHGLGTWWAGAVASYPLRLHVDVASLMVGGVVGLTTALAAGWWATRGLRRAGPLTLLFGWRALLTLRQGGAGRVAGIVAILALAIAALSLGLARTGLLGMAVAAYFVSGTALLVGLLAAMARVLAQRSRPRAVPSTWSLAVRGVALRRTRSLLTAGLIAAAAFLLVTVGANRQDVSHFDTTDRTSGSGGFSLQVRTALPVHADLNTAEGREQAGFDAETSAALAGVTVMPFRSSDGEDASCLNPQAPQAIRVLGATPAMIGRGGFAFAAVEERIYVNNPWELLSLPLKDGPVPAFGDAASVQWILHKGLGDVTEVPTPTGEPMKVQIVGLLQGSIFQSELIVSEEAFVEHFGREGGYRYFLAEAPTASRDRTADALRQGLVRQGAEVRSTAEVLAAYAEVQNVYLTTFQTLGGLGLLVGTFGVVVVLLRNVIERRGELALLSAVGYRRGRLIRMVTLENGLTLTAGVLIGATAALLASAPAWTSKLADVHWPLMALTLVFILAVGWGVCAAASALALRGDLIAALRSE